MTPQPHPIPVLDAGEAASWDERASTAQIPSRVLMEAAGRATAAVIGQALPRALGRGVLVVAGHGNNGGDAWVTGRALRAAGATVWAVETDKARSPDCDANRHLALDAGVELLSAKAEWPPAGVLIDGLLGTGAAGAPRGVIAELATKISRHGGAVVAIDGPTGLDLSTGQPHGPVRAILTVTFGGARRGHLLAREWCGEIVIVDIGFPAPDPRWPVLFHDGTARVSLPSIDVPMHKGDRGRVLIIGGDRTMAGAALHAASAAFGAGAGLVRIAGSEPTVRAAQASLPDALTLVTELGPKLEAELVQAIEWADALVLGPGLGRGREREAYVSAVMASCADPVVIDADALHAGNAIMAGSAPRVLTPHPGEFRAAFPDLADRAEGDRFAAAAEAGARSHATVLLKGVPTIIARPDGAAVTVVPAGNPALATGGSGDLLAGFIGAFLARGLEPHVAAALGAHTLGRAAELAAAEHGVRATRPADVLAALPSLWRSLNEPPLVEPPVLLRLPMPAVG